MHDAFLTKSVAKPGFDVGQAMRWAKATTGKGIARQLAEIARLAILRSMPPLDYYLYGLFAPDLSAKERGAFLSDTASMRLNRRLNDKRMSGQLELLRDKVLAGFVLQALGLPMPRLKAHFSTVTRLAEPATMGTVEEIVAFFHTPGALPAFGKPVMGSRALGAASFLELADDGRAVLLGDGRKVPLAALAADIAASYPDGYIFQELMRHGPEMAALAGPTIGMARIVTVQSDDGPQVLYALIRFPAPGAMVDAKVGGRNMVAHLDRETGRILRVQDMYRMSVSEVELHPETGARLPGFVLPHWPECLRLALQGHAGLPGLGLLGWDIGLSESGPMVTEANSNPHGDIYQRAARRGLLNPDIKPQIDAAQRFCTARVAMMKAAAARWG